MPAKTMTVKQRLWLGHVKAADASDGSIADYAQTHGLRLKMLYQWKTKLVKLELYKPDTEPTSPDFIPVTQVQSVSSTPSCTVKLVNGAIIEFAGELDSRLIRSIIANSGLKR